MLEEYPRVFYMCSEHKAPAKDHADYQGKLYYNRQWKRTDGTAHVEEAVSTYIKEHKVKCLQDIIKAPVYLTTRPYCKHVFIPMNTVDVLTADGDIKARNVIQKRPRKQKYKVRDYIKKELSI